MVSVYCSLVRSVLEYAVTVFAGLPQFLCNALEKVQKRALAIIFPSIPYDQALSKSGLVTLEQRREAACMRFINNIKPGNPLFPLTHNRVVNSTSNYSLRSGKQQYPMATKTDRFRNFVTVKYQDTN